MNVKKYLTLLLFVPLLLSAQTIFDNDGSNEAGFVAPIIGEKPPAPRSSISSAETFIPGGAPVVPQARSEKKNMPKPPVLFTKISTEHGKIDWATRPNDLNNLLKSIAEMIDVHYSMEIKSFSEVSTDVSQNPILYRTGHFRFSLNDNERAKLREYLLNGGMVILNAGSGSKPFFLSAIEEMEKTFPEVGVIRLESDSPIFSSYYDISSVSYRQGVRNAGFTDNIPEFYAVVIDCRIVALISRWGLDVGWDATEDDSLLAYETEDAKRLGVNILTYAVSQQAWLSNLTQSVEFIDANSTSASSMQIAQIIYDGEWKTRSAGLSVLLHQFNQSTEIPVRFARSEVRLTDASLYDKPLIYITGHGDFRFSNEEVNALRAYLMSGGLLFAEACCGRAAFDVAFRREIARVLPAFRLSRISSNDLIFRMPTTIQSVEFTPALASNRGINADIPELLGISIGPSYSVIYSPIGLSGGWELSADPYALALNSNSALTIGTNILFYSLTQ